MILEYTQLFLFISAVFIHVRVYNFTSELCTLRFDLKALESQLFSELQSVRMQADEISKMSFELNSIKKRLKMDYKKRKYAKRKLIVDAIKEAQTVIDG